MIADRIVNGSRPAELDWFAGLVGDARTKVPAFAPELLSRVYATEDFNSRKPAPRYQRLAMVVQGGDLPTKGLYPPPHLPSSVAYSSSFFHPSASFPTYADPRASPCSQDGRAEVFQRRVQLSRGGWSGIAHPSSRIRRKDKGYRNCTPTLLGLPLLFTFFIPIPSKAVHKLRLTCHCRRTLIAPIVA